MSASHDLREQTPRLLSEGTGISAENVASAEGLSSHESTPLAPVTEINRRHYLLSRRFKTTYKKASTLEPKTTSDLDALLNLSSWTGVTDDPSGDAPIDAVTPNNLTGFHVRSIPVKAMDEEFCLFFVMHTLLLFAHF